MARCGRQMKPMRRILMGILVGAIVLVLALYGGSVLMIRNVFSHRVERFEVSPEDLGIKAETLCLTSADGIPLKAWWVPADDMEPKGIVVLLHGMDGMDASTMLGHARFLHEAGYGAVALDMRAHGGSGGRRIGLAFEEHRDVAAVLDWIEAQPELKGRPVTLLGISMGGAVALRTAAMRPDVAAVISVSSFASVDRMMSDFMVIMGAPRPFVGLMTPFVRLAFFTIYGVWPETASPVHDIGKIPPRPILLLHGTRDDQVPVEHAYLLEEASGDRAALSIVDGAGHCIFETIELTSPKDRQYIGYVLGFLDRVR